jgi:hypothetical protein
MEDRTLNTTEINSDFYKLQDYNSLNELFQTILRRIKLMKIILTTLINNSPSLENMSDGFVAINEKWSILL